MPSSRIVAHSAPKKLKLSHSHVVQPSRFTNDAHFAGFLLKESLSVQVAMAPVDS